MSDFQRVVLVLQKSVICACNLSAAFEPVVKVLSEFPASVSTLYADKSFLLFRQRVAEGKGCVSVCLKMPYPSTTYAVHHRTETASTKKSRHLVPLTWSFMSCCNIL